MESLNYSESLTTARNQIGAGKPGKAFPWYLLAVQLLKDASENESATLRRARVSDDNGCSGQISPSTFTLDRIEGEVVSAFVGHSTALMVIMFSRFGFIR